MESLTCCAQAWIEASPLHFKSFGEFISVVQLWEKLIGSCGSLEIRIPSATLGLWVCNCPKLIYFSLLVWLSFSTKSPVLWNTSWVCIEDTQDHTENKSFFNLQGLRHLKQRNTFRCKSMNTNQTKPHNLIAPLVFRYRLSSWTLKNDQLARFIVFTHKEIIPHHLWLFH